MWDVLIFHRHRCWLMCSALENFIQRQQKHVRRWKIQLFIFLFIRLGCFTSNNPSDVDLLRSHRQASSVFPDHSIPSEQIEKRKKKMNTEILQFACLKPHLIEKYYWRHSELSCLDLLSNLRYNCVSIHGPYRAFLPIQLKFFSINSYIRQYSKST